MTAIAFMQLALIGLAVAATFFAFAWLKSKSFTFSSIGVTNDIFYIRFNFIWRFYAID